PQTLLWPTHDPKPQSTQPTLRARDAEEAPPTLVHRQPHHREPQQAPSRPGAQARTCPYRPPPQCRQPQRPHLTADISMPDPPATTGQHPNAQSA
ncbi:hypothetical protein CRENBAI_006250, partial [Crenichthys baileyi]